MAKFKRLRNTGYNQNNGVPGVVYILENRGLREGFYKIGCSRYSGAKRARDLNYDANTGTPGIFKCIFEYPTKDCGNAEKDVFKVLAPYRDGKKGQEFFQLNALQFEMAKEAIVSACKKMDSIIYEIEQSSALRTAENSRVIANLDKQLHSQTIETTQNFSNIPSSLNQGKFEKPKSESVFGKIIFFLILFFCFKWFFNDEHPKRVDLPDTDKYANNAIQYSNQNQKKITYESTEIHTNQNQTDTNAPINSPRHRFDEFGNEVNYGLREATQVEIQDSEQSMLEPISINSDDLSNQVLNAEKAENLKTCLAGKYSSLCKHDLLNEDQSVEVLNAEKAENLKTCLTGKYSSLCKHDLLNEDQSVEVLNAEKAENLKTCLIGKYPSLCKHDLLNDDQFIKVLNAEKAENLKICLDGRYPSLCNHKLSTE